jgi:hypothetical protein
MALTTYTAATDIIENLGTNPEDRPTLTDETFKAKFDENAVNIAAFLNALIAELASTDAGKGASAIGVEDSAGRITATNVEAALAEIAGAGRTTETLKGLADLLSTHTAKNAIDGHATMPSCRVYHNTTQSTATGGSTTLAFNSERFDTDTMHDVSTNNSRLTAKTAGKYLIIGSVAWADNATGIRGIAIVKGGGSQIAYTMHAAPATFCFQTVSTIIDMAINEYVELSAYQTSGGALNILNISAHSPEFMMTKIA